MTSEKTNRPCVGMAAQRFVMSVTVADYWLCSLFHECHDLLEDYSLFCLSTTLLSGSPLMLAETNDCRIDNMA